MDNKPIAVFDSGLGGLSVLRALRRRLPEENFLYFGDSENAPYGSRPTEEIRALTIRHADCLFAQGAKALVVACNTATSAAIEQLRARYPDRIIVGIEPALKLAVTQYPHGRIAVMATEATLREKKFSALMAQHSGDCEIIKCPCPELVEFVERGELEGSTLEACLRQELHELLETPPDAIVLGCTHFPFLQDAIRRVVGSLPALLDGADGTARETARRLAQAGLLCSHGVEPRTLPTDSTEASDVDARPANVPVSAATGTITLTNSRSSPALNALAQKLLQVRE